MATTAPAVPSGPAHVAVVSFLAARAAPTGGFWIALAGGVALARVAAALRRAARLRREHRRDARDRGHHRPGPLRHPAHPGGHRADARPPRGTRLGGALADPRLRRAAPGAQHRHHGVLHLGDRRRPRRLRRHLRRDRPPPGPGGGQRGRAGAHRGRPGGLGGLRIDRAGARLPARTGALGRHGRGRACDRPQYSRSIAVASGTTGAASTRACSRWRRWRRSWRCWRPRRGGCFRRWRCCWRWRGS